MSEFGFGLVRMTINVTTPSSTTKLAASPTGGGISTSNGECDMDAREEATSARPEQRLLNRLSDPIYQLSEGW